MITVTCAKLKEDNPFPPLKLVGHVVAVLDRHGRAMAHASGRAITSIVLRLANDDEGDQHAERTAKKQHETDMQLLGLMQQHEVTNQRTLRELAALNFNDVSASVGRILRAKWAIAGKRGEPYTVTAEGQRC